MSDRSPLQHAPLPRSQDTASFSEFVPFRSSKIRLARSPVFWFVVIAGALNVFLFGLLDTVLDEGDIAAQYAAFELFEKLVLFYILALSLLAVHAYAKTDKSILGYIPPCAAVYAFMTSRYWNIYYDWFAPISGEPASKKSADFLTRLWGYTLGTGLREEIVKGAPILVAAAITVLAARAARKAPPRQPGPLAWLLGLLRVRGPLDGVLMGFAAGCAFLFFETAGQYVHNIMRNIYMNNGNNAQGAFGGGLMLLLPRAMNGWVGHMAWAGSFGYFVGLAVIRPRFAIPTIAIGLLATALLHGLWDAVPSGDAGQIARYATAAASGILAMGCLLKARQLETVLFGTGRETSGSIVIPPGFKLAPPAATPAAFAPIPPPASSDTWISTRAPAAHRFLLDFSGQTLPLVHGALLDLAAQPGLSQWAPGVKAEVTSHPTDPAIAGLRNRGTGTWYARLRDQTIQAIEPDRSLRLAEGVSIDFGGLVGRVVAG